MSTDWVVMLGNLSGSFVAVQTLLAGFAYLLGLLLVIIALTKFQSLGDSHGSQEKMSVPMAYLLGGVALIFLPSTISVLSNTAFGVGNVLQYIPYDPHSIYNSVGILVQTAGLIWFIRGCILLIHGSEPGAQEGPKGLAFLAAGILAMNFNWTMGLINSIITYLMQLL